MSFCPSKDIHSVYLDNELPEVYKAEYEAHIAVCQTVCDRHAESVHREPDSEQHAGYKQFRTHLFPLT